MRLYMSLLPLAYLRYFSSGSSMNSRWECTPHLK